MRTLKYSILIPIILLIASCGQDDDPNPTPNPTTNEVTSSFDISNGPFVTKRDITFTNNSEFATSYLWEFGDNNTSTQVSPTYQYSNDGNYVIELTAFDADGKSEKSSKPITVEKNADLLTASFTFPSGALYYQRPVKFTNTSEGVSSSSWVFGDGETSSQSSPTHIYTEPGFYTVSLTTTDGVNSKTTSKTVIISIKTVRKKLNLRGITALTHDEKIFGDIDISVINTTNGFMLYEELGFWDNQGNATNTGISGTENSFDNINKSIPLTLDEYLLSEEKYNIVISTNVGSWHRDNFAASWGRIFNYNKTQYSFTTDGSTTYSTPTISTVNDPGRVHKFKVYLKVE